MKYKVGDKVSIQGIITKVDNKCLEGLVYELQIPALYGESFWMESKYVFDASPALDLKEDGFAPEQNTLKIGDSLSRRDQFAMAAMQGALSGGHIDPDAMSFDHEEFSYLCVGIADALIAELDKKASE